PQPNVIGVVPSVAAPIIHSCGSGTETEAVTPLLIPTSEIAQASATPGTVAPVVMVPGNCIICVALPTGGTKLPGTLACVDKSVPVTVQSTHAQSCYVAPRASNHMAAKNQWILWLAVAAGIYVIAQEHR
ncbi:MAG: hypothetical protein ACRETA_14145, partial [Gammaproteobacteria bacterium]